MEFLLLLILPVFWPLLARHIWPHHISWQEVGLNVLIMGVLVTGVWFAGKYHNVTDIKILNSEIIHKDRVHGTYEESYSCRCRPSCSGSGKSRSCYQKCDTCHRTHYTVDWTAKTRHGEIELDTADSTSSSVYETPDPKVYAQCYIGEPAATTETFTNYVKAVSETIFQFLPISEKELKEIPEYPTVYGHYKYNRVVFYQYAGQPFDAAAVNEALNQGLKSVGFKKGLNIVLVITSKDVPQVKAKIDSAWKSGKVNDIILYLNIQNGVIADVETSLWVNNIGNEIFASQLKDEFRNLALTDLPRRLLAVADAGYQLPDGKAFDYLQDEVQPPEWVIWLSVFLSSIGTIGLSIFFKCHEDGNCE